LSKIPQYKTSRHPIQRKPSCFMKKDGQTNSYEEANSHFSQFLPKEPTTAGT
jgi:hypothetical protein